VLDTARSAGPQSAAPAVPSLFWQFSFATPGNFVTDYRCVENSGRLVTDYRCVESPGRLVTDYRCFENSARLVTDYRRDPSRCRTSGAPHPDA